MTCEAIVLLRFRLIFVCPSPISVCIPQPLTPDARSSKEAATDMLAFVKAPHPWLLTSEEEYERSHREVGGIWRENVLVLQALQRFHTVAGALRAF